MAELPPSVRTRVRRLTRQAEQAEDTASASRYRDQRDQLLDEYGFGARIREDATGRTLVCYPQEWLEDGTVCRDRIEDTDRAVELSLGGPDDPDDWEAVEAHNTSIAQAVEETHGPVHGANAMALAEFASNYYAKPVEALTDPELTEFREEYYPRNVWSTERQDELLAESITLAQQVATSRS